ncbi:MAG: EF2563 family selenium-dependent molybdenum hydroxylase system protein [Erysipelotrichaceae bacterium]|nr:EF2563 family selenium-dependent molybdenum hydroxylase system protein [Erysipelotrichaceae bacterium]
MTLPLVIVRGGGDLASGTIYKLHKCGFPVLVLEDIHPSAIRRHVAFSEAVYEGTQTIEDVSCVLAESITEAQELLMNKTLCMLVDPKGEAIQKLKPAVVVDAILAKRNLGTTKDMAPVVIGLGPGFTASVDCDYVIETKRGHTLGKVIRQGRAIENTGIPGIIGGYGKERVIHAAYKGILHNVCAIGDIVRQGTCIATIESDGISYPVEAAIDGVLRGLIREGYPVTKGFKIADIDPRSSEQQNCFTISDKARCIAGGVLEAVMEGLKNHDLLG